MSPTVTADRAAAVAARAGDLLGVPCTPGPVLSHRTLPTGEASVLVTVLRSPHGDVVAKQGPAHLTLPGSAAQSAVRAAVSAAGAGPRVPRVLATDRGSGLVVMERATGTTLAAAIAEGAFCSVRQAGRALAALHALPATRVASTHGTPVAPRPATLADHLRDLVLPQPHVLAAHGLPTASVVRAVRLVDALLAAEAALPTGEPALVHRDVHPRQVLLDGDATWLLDWDLAAVGDPAVDVGNLVAHVRTHQAPLLASAVVSAFLAGYRSRRTQPVLARVAPFEAFTYLRLACKVSRDDGPHRQERVDALLDRCALALAGADRG
jgi:aminoglycoside phosphotransferase (APT) family kinase protein